ncbi:hypothetical protein CRG98_044228 [Punica granatum]|uniref:Retrotransposon gag domain-containing protein n=1 Tax=Punica granatum TaxID=22663 RepID=A0A2I0HV34_PUNGR|nr:hypothetical protein CRG98_044228 [Punica granatum]
MSQLATTVSKLEGAKGKLPSPMEINPRENASAITLRSGKVLELAVPSQNRAQDKIDEGETRKEKSADETKEDIINTPIQKIVISPPFPGRFASAKKEEAKQEILETFRKVEVNIPLLDVIKHVPRYAKFLKELCTNKRKLNGQPKRDPQRKLNPTMKEVVMKEILKLLDLGIIYPISDSQWAGQRSPAARDPAGPEIPELRISAISSKIGRNLNGKGE